MDVASKALENLKTARPLTTRTEVLSFRRMCNVCRGFVQIFAKVAAPVTELTKKGYSPRLLELSTEQLEAFETLKLAMTHAPVLKLARADRLFTVETDASA